MRLFQRQPWLGISEKLIDGDVFVPALFDAQQLVDQVQISPHIS
jgi:hypothetical protein